MLDLNYLCKMAYENAKKRAEHEPTIRIDVRNTLKHCAGEVVEATEAYERYIHAVDKTTEAYERYIHAIDKTKEAFADELADIICCVLTICGQTNIDIELALTKCMEKNFRRGHKYES